METDTFTAFIGLDRVAQGTLDEVTAALAPSGPHPEGLLVFSDRTGRVTDLDLTGAAPRPRGRPKLGVKAREVTLLPRHWDWLGAQRGGASAALRRLIDAAIAAEGRPPTPDRAYRFLSALAGDFPHYEEALRALYAGDASAFAAHMADWPRDIRDHALALARFG